MVAMTTVLSFIEKEMRKNINTQPAKKIRSLLGIDFLNVVAPGTQVYDIGQAMQIWKSMVNYGKPWDHKPILKKKFGDWSHDGVTGKDYFFDIWSNIHYGYVGRSVGFSMWTLKSGAGYAQYKAGTNPSGYWARRAKKWGDADFLAAFDDPKDQAAIDLGGALWEDKTDTFTHKDFVDRVRARAPELSTR